MYSKSVKLLYLTLLVLCLVEVRPTLHVVFVDSNHLILARWELTILPVDGLLLWTVATTLEYLFHPLYCCKLPLVLGHEETSVTHDVV